MAEVTQAGPTRLASVDAYRGLVMVMMASSGLGLAAMAKASPESPTWRALADQFEHVAWRGCTAWDLIQPSFMFLVGVAMPFSYASRVALGHDPRAMFRHALLRSAILVALGVFLQSNGSPRTQFSFVNVLTQIGLGYPVLFLLLNRRPAVQFIAALAILAAYGAWFAATPIPAESALPPAARLPDDWTHLAGVQQHWEKHRNAAEAFDRWLLNRLPTVDGKPFEVNRGGYATLNFVPSIATMIFGLLAGRLLRANRGPRVTLLTLAGCSILAFAAGVALDQTVSPSVKRIWTPAWVFFSTGWTLALLAAFYGVIDVLNFRRWAFPLVVVGVNSIAMYVMAQLMKPFLLASLRTHFGRATFEGTYGPMIEPAAVLVALWLICLWMYRQRIFVKI